MQHKENARVIAAACIATFTLVAWTGWANGLVGGWAAVFVASLSHLGCAFAIQADLARKMTLLAALMEVLAVGIFLR